MVFNDSTYMAYLLGIISCAVLVMGLAYVWYRDGYLSTKCKYLMITYLSLGLFWWASAYTRYALITGMTERAWMFQTWWWVWRTWILSITALIVSGHVTYTHIFRHRRSTDWNHIEKRECLPHLANNHGKVGND